MPFGSCFFWGGSPQICSGLITAGVLGLYAILFIPRSGFKKIIEMVLLKHGLPVLSGQVGWVNGLLGSTNSHERPCISD